MRNKAKLQILQSHNQFIVCKNDLKYIFTDFILQSTYYMFNQYFCNFQVRNKLIWPKFLNNFFMRGLFGCIGVLCFYQGIKMVSISEGQVLFRTSPLWTSLMAIYYLKTEQFSKNLELFQLLSLLLKILGDSNVDIVTNQKQQLIGVILMLSSAIFSSIIQVLINTLSKQVNQLVILQYFSVISMFVSSLTVLSSSSQVFVFPTLHDAMILFLIGVTSYFYQLLMNRAYMTGNLTEISMLGQFQVIYRYIFDIKLGSHISILSIIGTILIATSLIKEVIDKSKRNARNQAKQNENE